MLRRRSRIDRYCGWITDWANTCGFRLDCHDSLASVVEWTPCASSVVLRTSCRFHSWPSCVAVPAHWKRRSWPSSLKVNTRTSLNCTSLTPSCCVSVVPRALMMLLPSRAHSPLAVLMPRLADRVRNCIACACWSPQGAAVSPRITTPTISTATTPAADDDRAGLLALQHRLGDFLGIGEVADARLDHLHAGLFQAGLDLVAQVVVDHLAVAAQRRFAVLVRVVRVALRHLPQRRLALNMHVILVVVDAEHRLGGVQYLPDHHRGDLDRVAVVVVDLQLAALEIAYAQRNALLGVERIGPAQPLLAHRAGVPAEQLQHQPLVRRDLEEALQHEGGDHLQRKAGNHADHVLCRRGDQHREGGRREQHDAEADKRNTCHRKAIAFVHGVILWLMAAIRYH